jgi:ubiquinone/menaquinone biosynthesis C-methylase UbiE
VNACVNEDDRRLTLPDQVSPLHPASARSPHAADQYDSECSRLHRFDPVAGQFERHRELPADVAPRIRDSLWHSMNVASCGPVLEIGAGTGRIGRAFHTAGDAYVGVDSSRRMLDQFAAWSAACGVPAPNLVQGDGRLLPFTGGTFEAVLLVQVLSGQPDWRQVLDEARRVLSPVGALALGQIVRPADGVDRQLRDRLSTIMAELGTRVDPLGARTEEVVAWLAPQARWHASVTAATWKQSRTPREFLNRHATGARFAALPTDIQAIALTRLESWASDRFGGLDLSFDDCHEFELDVFKF